MVRYVCQRDHWHFRRPGKITDAKARAAIKNFGWARGAIQKMDCDLAFPGERGLNGAFEDEIRWFDAWLKGAKNGIREEPAVTYYHMASARKGALSPKNELRRVANWPPASRATNYSFDWRRWLLSLRLPAAKETAAVYKHDPGNPVPTLGGANYNNNRQYPIMVGPVDQRPLKGRSDYLDLHCVLKRMSPSKVRCCSSSGLRPMRPIRISWRYQARRRLSRWLRSDHT